jgi:hypothetical protein
LFVTSQENFPVFASPVLLNPKGNLRPWLGVFLAYLFVLNFSIVLVANQVSAWNVAVQGRYGEQQAFDFVWSQQ